MVTIHRILCPIDFSPGSDEVLARAAALARYHEATLTVLHVAAGSPVPAGPTPGRRQPARALWLQRLRDITQSLRDAEENVSVVVREGEPVRRILEEAAVGRADLIVMGTKGRTGVSRLLLGSVAEAVLRQASCPVLTVPPPALERSVPAEGRPFGRILCPIDFSDASWAALDYGLSLAQEAQGRVILLHVFEEGVAREVARAWPTDGAGVADDLLRFVPDGAHDWCDVRTLMAAGDPSDEILRVAHEQAVDLIAMGAPRRSGRAWGLDSTAGRVVREAPCPVMTLRALASVASVEQPALRVAAVG